jgi:pyruvate/2-oxoglutarate dehydrogenase complex dihydrolipoamide dehydrogenase (E3) component
LIFGEGSFVASDRVRVALREGGERELSAPRIIINVGGRPSVPNLPGLANVPFLDSTSIMELDKIPERLLVLGGGYIGLEFAQMFRRFGSTVTVIQRNQQLLPNEDDDIAHAVTSILREDGIEIFTDMVAQSVELNGSTIRLTIASGGSERICEGTHLLVAVGRTPNTDALNLASAGIQVTSQGTIPVNNRLETVIPGIYALGDVNGGPQFTHVAYDDYRILKTNLLDGGQADTSQRIPVYTMFIDPQLGRVGLTEKQARSTGRAIRVVSIPMTWVARSLEMDESRGLMKAIVDTSTQQILGAAVLGIEGGELMSVLQVAILGQVAYPKLRDAIFAHPTLAESLNTLFASLPEG